MKVVAKIALGRSKGYGITPANSMIGDFPNAVGDVLQASGYDVTSSTHRARGGGSSKVEGLKLQLQSLRKERDQRLMMRKENYERK